MTGDANPGGQTGMVCSRIFGAAEETRVEDWNGVWMDV